MLEQQNDEATGSSIYLHPLAYLLGLEGVASMRAFAGEHDRAFSRPGSPKCVISLTAPTISVLGSTCPR